MNWIQRKIYLYNVTFGLFMLDWWERCLFNIFVIVLIWFILNNGYRSIAELHQRQIWGGSRVDPISNYKENTGF